LALTLGAAPAANAPEAQAEDAELQIGRETFNELKKRGEIIKSSPLYDVLMPVIDPIMKAAQPRYKYPFKVYLVHEAQPNAFATQEQRTALWNALS
jgi:predicted Zn-dependent protease